MPIYEYTCPQCGTPFEKRVSFSAADDAQDCPNCGNSHAKRQISLIGGTSGGSQTGSISSTTNCGPVG